MYMIHVHDTCTKCAIWTIFDQIEANEKLSAGLRGSRKTIPLSPPGYCVSSPCVSAWQPSVFSHTLYAEFLGAVAAHQFPETTNRKTTGTCDKLQQTNTLLVVKLTDALWLESKGERQ